MRSYPLIRRKWSNEHIMAMLFVVILLYLAPRWIINPYEVTAFLAALATALVIDAVAGFLKYKRLVCSVSAAVTTGVLQVLTPGIPLWGRLVGAAAAILLGKTLWGGTGKNTLNPAIVGYLAIYLLFSAGYAPIAPSILLIPAIILTLPFILVRPFASIGLMTGMALSILIISPSAGLMNVLINCLFFGGIIITDPVTTTPLKIPGLIGAFAVGFVPLMMKNPALNLAMLILIFNLISYLIDDFSYKPSKRLHYIGPTIKSKVAEINYSIPALDLTNNNNNNNTNAINDFKSETAADPESGVGGCSTLEGLPPELIIERIRDSEVYGCGGAAFPAVEKIKGVLNSAADKKYMVINGVECDPGLIHDKWLLRNRVNDILQGIKAIGSCIKFTEVILAVKDTDGLKFSDNISLHQVKDHYPAGYEKLLIESTLRKTLPDGAIPSNEGILVLNVQTLIMVYEAVFLCKKATEKYITVSDMKAGKAAVVKVKTGDNIMRVLDAVYPGLVVDGVNCSPMQPGKQPVFTGGGAMMAHMADETSEIGRETNFIADSNIPRYKESPFCSGCGTCEANCPQRLRIRKITELADAGKHEETGRFSPEKCIKCGICSYICPGGRNLSARVIEAKDAVLKSKAV
jgi:electron transport complex protein RnfC